MRLVILISIVFISISSVSARGIRLFDDYKPTGFLDLNLYQDSRVFSTITLNSQLNLLGPFSYFSFVNWEGSPTGDEFGDISDHYVTEQNLYAKLGQSPFDLHAQYFSLTGRDNDVLRFGVQSRVEEFPIIGKWLKKINATYHITYFPWQVDSINTYASQIQHVWFINILPKRLNNRLYILGFADQNFNTDSNGPHTKLIVENQFGFRIWKDLHAIAELRWNGFFPEQDKFGIGMGLQYKWNF